MPQFFRRKLAFLVTVLLFISGVFLFSKAADSAWDSNAYNKPYNGTLTATEWNNLFLDFANTWLPVTMKGPVTIGGATSSSLTVNGSVSATTFSGAYTGTLGAQNISSGQFGSNTGGGNYSFPGNLGIGTTTPSASLHVDGSLKLSGLTTNTAVKALTAENDGTIGTRELSQMAFKEEANYTLNSTSYMTFMSSPGYVDTYYARFKVTVTRPGDNVSGQVMFVEIYGSKNYVPSIIVKSHQNSTSSTDSGLRYLRVSYPTARNNGAPVHIDMAAYSTDARDVKVELVEAKNLELRQTIVSSLYNAANQTVTTPTIYYNGNVFNKTIYGSISGNAGSAGYASYGVYGGYSLSNTTSKTGQWEYIGNIYMAYNSTYSFGQSWNIDLRLREVVNNNTDKPYDDMEEAQLTLKGFMAAAANGTAFRDTAPSFSVYLNGNDLELTPSDVAMLVYSSDTGAKYLRLYVKLKKPNTHYQILPQNRYGASYSSANAVSPDYCYFNTVTGQAVIASLPSPYQGSVVYATQGSGTGVWRLNGADIYNSNSGNVGVGTSTPSSKLTLSGGDFAIDHNKSLIVNSASQNTTLLLGNYADGGGFTYGTSSSPLRYAANLAVEGDVKADRLCIEEDCKAAWSEIVFAGGGGQWVTSGNNIYNANSANVGIGTTNPGYKLDVVGDARLPINNLITFGGYLTLQAPMNNSAGWRRGFIGNNLYWNNAAGNWQSNSAGGGDVSGISFNNAGTVSIIARNGYTQPRTFTTAEVDAMANMTFLPSGNVGIGTTNPSNTLHISNSNWNGHIQLTRGSTNGYITLGGGDGLFLGSNSASSNMLGVFNSGNVGIGTTSPVAKLAISGGTGNIINIGGGQIAGLNSTPLNSDHAVPLGYLQSNYVPIGSGSGGLGSGTSGQTLRHNGTSWVGNSVLYNNGTNVGIGTTTPGARLTVEAPSTFYQALIKGTSSGNAGGLYIQNNVPNTLAVEVTGSTEASNPSAGIIYTRDSLSKIQLGSGRGTPQFTLLTSSGNVGIGTTDPLEKLHVGGNAVVNGYQQTLGATYSGDGYWLGGNKTVGIYRSTNDIRFKSTSDLMTIASNGNVGIGTTSPIAKLAISGGTGNVINVGGGQIAGLNSTPLNSDHAVPLGYLQSNYVPIGSGSGGLGSGTSGQTLRHNGTSWVANSLLFNDGTNVGVGTSTPASKLHVYGLAGRVATFGDIGPSTQVANPVNVSFGSTYGSSVPGSVNNLKWDLFTSSSSGSRYGIGMSANLMEFQSGPGGGLGFFVNQGTEAMRIASSGNVGLGTTVPGAKLEVEINNSGSDSFLFSNSFNNNGLRTGNSGYAALFGYQQGNDIGSGDSYGTVLSMNAFYDGTNWSTKNGWIRPSFINLGPAGNIIFATENAGQGGVAGNYTPTEVMRIARSGNVGIGTTNPVVKLHVSGGTGNVINVGGGQIAGLNSTPLNSDHAVPLGYLQSNYVPIGSGSGGLGSGTSGQTLRHDGTSWVSNSTLFNNGTNVGIGITNPGAKLDISGSVRTSGQFISTVAQGTAPLAVNSNTVVTNLNADLLDGSSASLSPSPSTIPVRTATGGITPYAATVFSLANGFDDALSQDVVYYGSGSTNATSSPWAGLFNGSMEYFGDASRGFQIAGDSGGAMFAIRENWYGSWRTWRTLWTSANLTNPVTASTVGTSGYIPVFTSGTNIGNSVIYTASSNVGISTTSPVAKLAISGGTGNVINVGGGQIAGLNSTPLNSDHAVPLGYLQANYVPIGSGSGGIGSGTSGQTLRHNGTSWVANSTIYNNGTNVGVGTTAPGEKLEIANGHGNTRARLYATGFGQPVASNDAFLTFWASEPGQTYTGVGIGNNVWNSGVDPFDFTRYNNNRGGSYIRLLDNAISANVVNSFGTSTTALHINGLANVGIGTTNPIGKLHVNDNIADVMRNVFYNTNAAGSVRLDLLGPTSNYALEFDNSTNGLTFRKSISGGKNSGTAVMSLDSSGNVGIGTTNPAAKFEIKGSGNTFATTNFRVANSDNTEIFTIQDHSVGKFTGQFQILGGAGTNRLYLDAGNAVVMGNVGIGTTSPIAKLAISGGTGNVINVGGGQIAGLNSTPLNSDHAVPLGYLQSNYVPIGSGSGGLGSGTSGQTLRHDGTSWVSNSTLFNNGTNVGIGTTNPVARLQVNGGVALKMTAVADTDYTAQADDYIIGYTSISANRTVTLPNALCTPGRFFVVVDQSGNASASAKILIDPEGTTPIIGMQNLPLQDSFNSVYVFCGNSAWYIL